MRNQLSIAEIVELKTLLQRRIQVIQDSEMREQNPEGQLAQLKEVGEALFAAHERLRGRLPGQLNHFLERCSYDKALEFVDELGGLEAEVVKHFD